MKCKMQKGVLKVVHIGAINRSTLSETAAAFLAALSKADEGVSVEIDLSETTEADSGTVKFLLAASADCRQRGLKLTVRAGGKTGELLQLTSLARLMNLILEEPSK